jgi:Spy/CpxP family protein refolding chaperone
MNRKKLLNSILGTGALLLAATFAPTTFAQSSSQEQSAPPANSQAAGGKHGEGRFAGLNLTDDQKAQIKKIHEDAKAKADAVMANTSLPDADKQTKVKAIHREARKQANTVLTPEQREQLRAKMRERRAERSQTQPS